MRKYLSGLLALICLMGLTACGGQAKQEDHRAGSRSSGMRSKLYNHTL